MAKRFIDTELFNDEWFMSLSVQAKLFYIYLFTNCNHAGIIELNEKLCVFQTKLKSLATLKQELGNRLVSVKNNNKKNIYFLPKFISFQYPNFPNSNVKQQESAIKILKKYNINFNSYQTVSEQFGNGYDNDNDNDNDNVLYNTTRDINNGTSNNNTSSNSTSSSYIINKEDIEKEELHPIQMFVNKKLEWVKKVDKQLTYQECEKLLNDFDPLLVKRKLEDMNNYKPLLKKCRNVNLTLRAWIRRDSK